MKLSDADIVDILIRRERGESVRSIASSFRVSISTVYRRIDIYNKEKRLGAKKRSRVKKLPTSELERIREFTTGDPFASDGEVIGTLGLNISAKTLRRYCRSMGLSKYRAPKKFYVAPIHCEERLWVARRRCAWTADQWNRIVFTDESGLDNSGFQQMYVRRPRGKRLNAKYVYRAPNATKRINYFSWVTCRGVGELIVYDRMDSQTFCHEVLPVMMQRLRAEFGGDNFQIIHDNAPFYTSNYTTLHLSRTGFDKFFISIPPYSPDMNIIEHLWAVLRRKVKRHCFMHGQSRGRAFAELVKNFWSAIPSSMIENLYRSLPVRLTRIVEAEGLPTKY